MRLVLLWYASYKNGSQHYMPDWMLTDPVRYFHALDSNGQAVDSPSPFSTASLEADKKAFAAFMGYLKEADPQRTVLMIQVENEPGDWASVRDFSPPAQKFFEAPVPAEILKAMPALTSAASPNWQQAYGPNANEYFNAWAVARYVGQVAAAGKAVYPLPMDVNVAVRNPFHPGPPGVPGISGHYESGAATDNVIPIWKAAAPAVDMLGPDDFQSPDASYLKVLELYHRDDNPLFLPEDGCQGCDRFYFTALNLGSFGAGAATENTQRFLLDPQQGNPSAWEDSKLVGSSLTPWAMNYRLLGPMQREIARLMFEGKLQAVAEERGSATATLPFGSWNAVVNFGMPPPGGPTMTPNPEPRGRVLVAQLGPNQFLVAGYFCRVDFWPVDAGQQGKFVPLLAPDGQTPATLIDGKWQHRQFLSVEEVTYADGGFKLIRSENGDATDYGLNFYGEPLALRVSVGTY